MSAHLKNIEIKNFKSLRDLKLDCARINIFLGKPNAGKSNILEAISLLGAAFSHQNFLKEYIRYDFLNQLFSDFRISMPIEIRTDEQIVKFQSNGEERYLFSMLHEKLEHDFSSVPNEVFSSINKIIEHNKGGKYQNKNLSFEMGRDGQIFNRSNHAHYTSPVRKYTFQGIKKFQDSFPFLRPPHGENLYAIAQSSEKLQEEIYQFLLPNGMEFLLDEVGREMFLFKRQGRSVIRFPLHLIPDTFQRYIFHLAAIFSNKDSVLLFEEPETHSYPPYVYQLARHILQDEQNNQYFITTHNPYLLTEILQEGDDVALFVTWFENFETKARRLTADEISEVLNYGLDIFLNLNHFIPE